MGKGPSSPRKTRPLTSAQLGRLGEARFATICTEVGLLPHKPDHDVNGWDFFVEFPQDGHARVDLAGRPQPLQCFVQVKTVWEGARDVDLGLSAAERLGKSPLPSFLCILEAEETREIIRLHVLHMGGPLLERVLKKLRQMEADGQSTRINKVGFRVPVSKASSALTATGAALRGAIDEAVGPDHAIYRREKDNFLRTAGFPTRPVNGTMTIRAESPGDYSDFLLGLKPLPVLDFEAIQTRWDISLPFRLPSKPVSVRLTPSAREVEVVWRQPGSLASVRLKMMATLAPGSGPDGHHDRWLIVHPNLEMRIDGASFALSLRGPNVVPTSYRTLVQVHALQKLMHSNEPVQVQLFWMGKRMVEWRHDESPLKLRSQEATTALGEILRELKVVLETAQLPDIQLPSDTWEDWREQLQGLCAMLEEPSSVTASVTVKLPTDGATGMGEHEALYVTALEFGEGLLAYYATCRASIEEDDLPRQLRIVARNFVVREIRLVEKSDEAMWAFRYEAEATTGLTTTLAMWGPYTVEAYDDGIRSADADRP